jgi:excisionase family DNA binding protein
MEPRRNLFTIGQASEYLGVSIDTLRRWEKKGRIEAFRSPGGHRYYERDDLDKLFGKKYVHDESHVQERQEPQEEIKVIPKEPQKPIAETSVPEETFAPFLQSVEVDVPSPIPTPPRIIPIPEKAPIQIARREEIPAPPIVEEVKNALPTQVRIESPHEVIVPPIPQRDFLVPQLSPLKEPARNEDHSSGIKTKTKETMQIAIIITILILVIILAIILVIMMITSSQSILSPSP